MRAAAASYDLEIDAALTAFPGNGRVQPLDAYLRLSPRVGPAVAADVWLSDKVALQIVGAEAWPRVSIRGENGGEGRRIRVVPLSASLVRRFGASDRVQPYAGLAVAIPLVRRAIEPVVSQQLHVVEIAQPDHGALVLQFGARVPLTRRWWAGIDAKAFPFESTFETHRAEFPRDALQTNFHPVIVSTGIGVRF